MQADTASTETLRQAWVRFASADSHEAYCQHWLEVLALRLGGVRLATLLLRNEEQDGAFVPLALYPAGVETGDEFLGFVEEGIQAQKGLVHAFEDGSFGLSFPIRLGDELAGLVAIQAVLDQQVLPQWMERVQWASAWVELLLRRQQGARLEERLTGLQYAIDVLGAILSGSGFHDAAIHFVNELGLKFSCGRVSLGLRKGHRLQVEAVSNTAQLRKKMNLVRQLSAIMEESLEQRARIQFPPPDDGLSHLVMREHARFSRTYDNAALLTVPLYLGDRYYGAVSLERPGSRPFTPAEVAQLESGLALAAEALQARQEAARPWYRKLGGDILRQLGRLFGPRYVGRKVLALTLLAAVAFLSVATGEYRVAADGVLEGEVRRAVVTPFDAYLAEARVKAGDEVQQGELMARLDDRDLRLERLRTLSEEARLQARYAQAVARQDRAEAKIAKAQLAQVAAQLKLVEEKIRRTRITAPFRGLVVVGDLSQRLGSASEQGEVLFEVSRLDSYRLILAVDEHRMKAIHPGLEGRIVLNALPEATFPFVITRVTSVTEARDGKNLFRVEARLKEISEALRPGMEGVAKIDAGERRLIWIWTYPLWQWARLKLWSWWP
jgi:multidrug resistance efflux pump